MAGPYVQNRDYYGAMQRGREDALNETYARQRNALGGIDLQQAQRVNALAGNPNASPEDYVRAGAVTQGNALGNMQQGRQQADAQRFFLAAQYGLASDRPKDLLRQHFPDIVAMNPNFEAETDEQIRQQLQGVVAKYGAMAGVGPPGQADPGPLEQIIGPDGKPQFATRRGALGQQPYIKPPTERPVARFRPMSPQEIQASGLPPGTAAQVNDETGQIQVLSKRDSTASLSQKDTAAAKQKLVTIQLAKQQLERIKQRFEAIKGTASAGAFGQGRLPTEGGKSFDAAVDQMRSTLTALTRTPGVGAMSDYETKLDQAKFPARTNYESVTAEQIQAIEDQLTLIERGYKGLLEGSAPEPQAAPQAPVRVNTPQEAMALPPGTQFVTPDGRVKVRP